MIIESFSARLQKGLKFRNIKPAQLAELTGLHRGTIANYISGKYEAKQTNLWKIAKVLNVSEAWLMGYDVPLDQTLTTNYTNTIDADKLELIGKINKFLESYDTVSLLKIHSLLCSIENESSILMDQILQYANFIKFKK